MTNGEENKENKDAVAKLWKDKNAVYDELKTAKKLGINTDLIKKYLKF